MRHLLSSTFLQTWLTVLIGGWLLCWPPVGATPLFAQPANGPRIHDVVTNGASYAAGQIPQYAKFELTFAVDTLAPNKQWPYDATPPAGIEPGAGVTVNALFSPDNWQTVFIQPAFYYQAFLAEQKDGQPWIYPTDNFSWKVRFTPHQPGQWQYKLTVQDANGANETRPDAFTVAPSANKGFIRVSQQDPRYFEYDNGAYFPALGYNLPLADLQASLPTLAANGIQFIRTWLPSQLSIFGAAWSPWRSYNPLHNGALPDARLRYDVAWPFQLKPGIDPPLARPESETFLWLSQNETVYNDGKQWDFTPCVVLGWEAPKLPVKRNTNYRVRVRYREHNLMGPKIAGLPFGFTVKLGGWLWSDQANQRCYAPGVGEILAASYSNTDQWSHQPDAENPGWQILEGNFNSGDRDFLDLFHLAIENATAGDVLVDMVWLEENLGNEQFGPNVIYKPWMAQHKYFAQRNSYVFDTLLDQAQQAEVYLKVVILEKQDYLLNIFQNDGTPSPEQPHERDFKLFWGAGRESAGKTKVRWLQEAWWRYLQARWGYSPNIHSWELVNEGDPSEPLHYILADELGKYFRTAFIPQGQQTQHPDLHLVTTSFWNNYPEQFWNSTTYPNVDYADIHHYAHETDEKPFEQIYAVNDFNDSALFSQKLSMQYGARQPQGANKPLVRGETAFAFDRADRFAQDATAGLWLHNFIWASINAGGLIEMYWTGAPTQDQIYKAGAHDYRAMYKTFYNFIHDIPLNNGHYIDLDATASSPNVRVWGQKDLLHGQAHVWIQNQQNTWKNVAEGMVIPPVSATITLPGFRPNAPYRLESWNPYEPDATKQITLHSEVVAQADGAIPIAIENLTSDIAVKIFDKNPPSAADLAVASEATRTARPVPAATLKTTQPATTGQWRGFSITTGQLIMVLVGLVLLFAIGIVTYSISQRR